MDGKRYQRVRELFFEACQLEARRRTEFLAAACGNDSDLLEEVEALLARDDQADGLLRSDADGVQAAASIHVAGKQEGAPLPKQVGPYRVLSLLGEGGMGRVFLAEQDRPRRQVALKVLRPGMTHGKNLQRFEQEAQLLGRLQHPGIAQVFEAGTFDHGENPQPFFAMEWIKGTPLGHHARENRLDIRQRLELLARICDAVQHAHEQGVIHRDLKPANILVDASGQPKILDFGVARITDSDIQLTTIQTAYGQLVGSVPYMSPEQAAADLERLDSRSDIYALGVIGYELLSGMPPYDVSQKMIHEAVRIIREEEPTPLSSVSRVFRGDIETIVAKALEKEPDRRYASAAELAADLRRYLADEPIVARPASTIYQVKKFARRHRALVFGVAAVFVTLTAGIIVAGGAALVAMSERKRAEQALEDATRSQRRAVQIQSFLQDMLASADPDQSRGEELTVREALEQAAHRLEVELAEQPEVAEAIHATIGNTYNSLGLLDEAERHYRAAVELARECFGASDLMIVDSLNNLGALLNATGQSDEARAVLEEAMEILAASESDDADLITSTQDKLAMVLTDFGEFESAARLFEDAITLLRQQPKDGLAGSLATALNNLGRLRSTSGEPEGAEPLFRESLELDQQYLGEDHPRVAIKMGNLAAVLHQLGRAEEALVMMREAVELRRNVVGPDHPDLAYMLNNLARMLQDGERPDEAMAAFRNALEAGRIAFGSDHPQYGLTLANMASLLVETGQLDEAEASYRQALTVFDEAYPADHWIHGHARSRLGECLTAMERFAEAEPLLLGGLELVRASLGKTHERTRQAMQRVVDLYRAWDQPARAAEYEQQLNARAEGGE